MHPSPAKEPLKEFGEIPVAEVKPDFEVPKFPDKILEELAAPIRPEPVNTAGSRDETPDVDQEPSPETDEFARLDRMVFGETETPASTQRVTEGAWEPTPEVPTTERTSGDYSSAPSESDGEEKPLERDESMSDESPKPAESLSPMEAVRDAEEFSPDETAAESGDDVGSVQWGRPKRKKLSR